MFPQWQKLHGGARRWWLNAVWLLVLQAENRAEQLVTWFNWSHQPHGAHRARPVLRFLHFSASAVQTLNISYLHSDLTRNDQTTNGALQRCNAAVPQRFRSGSTSCSSIFSVWVSEFKSLTLKHPKWSLNLRFPLYSSSCPLIGLKSIPSLKSDHSHVCSSFYKSVACKSK